MAETDEENNQDFPYYTLIKGAARAIESVEDSIEQLDQLNRNSELQSKLRAGVQAVCRACEKGMIDPYNLENLQWFSNACNDLESLAEEAMIAIEEANE